MDIHRELPPSFAETARETSRLAAQIADALAPQVEAMAALIWERCRAGGQVLACGNGGSAADAQHFAAELVGRFLRERRALAAVALTVDPSVMTSVSNDYGFESVFARQVEALGRPGDVLLGISTSGRSPNVLRAIEAAQAREMRVAVLAGEGGHVLLGGCDVCIHIPSSCTPRVQEMHIMVLHVVCDMVEYRLAAEGSEPGG